MAEWGFADMATAEAYWRRQQRQMHGANRKKLEAKFKDPAARLRKLQVRARNVLSRRARVLPIARSVLPR